jgi:hypothetical protein
MTTLEKTRDRLLVPEVLLAAAKDARYIDECRTLVQQVLDAFGRSDEGTAAAVSSILYALLVFLPKRKTLGMEATGVTLDKWQYKMVALSVATSFGAYALSKRIAAQEEESTESLRGASRRDVFLRQRAAMTSRTSQTNSGPVAAAEDSRRFSTSQYRIQAFLRMIRDALLSDVEGPHHPPGDSTTQRSWLQWLMRLHLGFYCMHGKYASWMHRFLGITFQQGEEGRLVNRPTAYRAIGALILSHAVGTSLLSVSRQLLHWWFDFCDRYTPTNERPTAGSLRDIHSKDNNASFSSQTTCGICHGPRTYSACPVDCGHVFCWTCLQKWVQTVRPECPICRSPCTAKDVIPLYNYDSNK